MGQAENHLDGPGQPVLTTGQEPLLQTEFGTHPRLERCGKILKGQFSDKQDLVSRCRYFRFDGVGCWWKGRNRPLWDLRVQCWAFCSRTCPTYTYIMHPFLSYSSSCFSFNLVFLLSIGLMICWWINGKAQKYKSWKWHTCFLCFPSKNLTYPANQILYFCINAHWRSLQGQFSIHSSSVIRVSSSKGPLVKILAEIEVSKKWIVKLSVK